MITRVLGLSALLTGSLAGQELLGFRSSLSTPILSSPSLSYGRAGLTIGPSFTIGVTPWLAVQGEALYTSNSIGWIEPTVGAATLRHFSMPVMARAQFGVPGVPALRAVLLGGVYSSYMLQCRLAGELGSCAGENPLSPFQQVTRFNYGPTAGVGLDANLFNVVRLGAEVRYQQGMRGVEFGDDMLRSRSWSVGLRLAGMGGGARSYTDAPSQHTLPNEQVPDLGPRWKAPRGS